METMHVNSFISKSLNLDHFDFDTDITAAYEIIRHPAFTSWTLNSLMNGTWRSSVVYQGKSYTGEAGTIPESVVLTAAFALNASRLSKS
jgi:hypothetical protein